MEKMDWVPMITSPFAIVSREKERSRGIDSTWTPKNVAMFLNVNVTVEFKEIMSVGTPVESVPA